MNTQCIQARRLFLWGYIMTIFARPDLRQARLDLDENNLRIPREMRRLDWLFLVLFALGAGMLLSVFLALQYVSVFIPPLYR